jgi:hypothetical protein
LRWWIALALTGCGVLAAVIFFLAGSGHSENNPQARRAANLLGKQERCKALVNGYHLALERVFEVEMRSLHSPPYSGGEWYKAAMAIGMDLFDLRGRDRDPDELVNQAVSRLVQVKDEDDRRRLEYSLLGSVMPLEARREFEVTCIVDLTAQ